MRHKTLAAAVAAFACVWSSSSSPAYADTWACEVILCLSNPGGPTQYAACVPPITKLYNILKLGGGFPICSGVGYRTSQPGYQPFYCNDGYTLTRNRDDDGASVGCTSNKRVEVTLNKCADAGKDSTARAIKRDGKTVCMDYKTVRPLERDQPNYVDVTIDSVGTQRVWY
ncbi:MAG: hypothetical protein MEP57_10160 [Microvirga sp.]|nr:hypothetical protein [Microvirga sp.]